MNRKLFVQLFIAAQVGGGDVQKLFQHETTREPPSLLKESEIRSGNKADLLPYLKDDLLKPNNSNTFTDYAEDIFSAAVRKEITKFDRIGIIFDTYKKNSLKAATRKKRYKGIRRKVENNS